MNGSRSTSQRMAARLWRPAVARCPEPHHRRARSAHRGAHEQRQPRDAAARAAASGPQAKRSPKSSDRQRALNAAREGRPLRNVLRRATSNRSLPPARGRATLPALSRQQPRHRTLFGCSGYRRGARRLRHELNAISMTAVARNACAAVGNPRHQAEAAQDRPFAEDVRHDIERLFGLHQGNLAGRLRPPSRSLRNRIR